MPYKDLSKNLANLYRNPNGGKSQAQTTSDDFNAITAAYLAVAAVKSSPTKTNAKKDSGIVTASDEKKAKQSSLNRYQGEGGNSTISEREKNLARSYGNTQAATGQRILADTVEGRSKSDPWLRLYEAIFKKDVESDISKESENQRKKAAEKAQKASEYAQKADEGLGKGGKFINEVALGGAQLATDVLINYATGGVGGRGMAFARGYAGGANEGYLEGKDLQTQTGKGLLQGSIEAATESMGGIFKGKTATKITDSVVSKLSKTAAGKSALNILESAGGKIVRSGLSEAGEEVVSGVLTPIAEQITGLEKRDKGGILTKEDWQEIMSDALVAGVLGSIGGGGQVISGMNKANAQRIAQDAVNEATARKAAQEALAGRQQTTPTAEQTTDTAQQGQLNSALQNEQPQVAANPLVAAVQNAERNANPEAHIDNRTMDSVGNRNVHAFQYEHPELHDFYVEAAEALKADVEDAVNTQTSQYGKGTTMQKSEAVERLMDEGLSRQDILTAIDAIERNHGAEDYAKAKRVELVLDEMLSNGYMPSTEVRGSRRRVAANSDYLNAKAQIEGSNKASAVDYKVQQAIDNVIEAAQFDGEDLTDEQALAEIAKFPELHGLTTADLEEYSANLRDYEFEDYNNPELPEGMGAASASFTGDASPVEQWVANAQYEGDSALHPISDEQIANLAEQQQRAPTEVPRVDINGRLTSKTVSTLANSGVTPEAMSDAIMQDAMNGKFSHIAYTDEAAQANAEAKIQDIGWEQALGEYRKDVLDGKVSKDITMLGVTLYNNAVTAGDYAGALDIVSLMTQNSTTMAQALQAMRILNKLSPDARLYMAVKSAKNIAAEIKQKYNLDNDIEIDPDLLGEYKEALDSGDKNAIREAWGNVEQNIADQIPSNWKDKLNAWRYLSMLGNPRTHVRNIVGNAGFAPVIAIKNVIATGIESGVEKLGGNIDRTKALLNPANAADRALIATAWADYANASEAIMSGGKYNDLPNTIEDRRQIFGFKPVEAVRKFNSNALNVEDKWFSQPAYANALASYLKANGITANEYAEGTLSEEAMAKAQAYAVKEAQKATYRDTNMFSQAVSKFRVKPAKEDALKIVKVVNRGANALVEGLLPFKKTPANILMRAVEYSPLGLGAEIATGLSDVKAGKKTAAEFIDGIASGLTGTGLLALGIYLASQGLLSGGVSGDDKQDEFNKLQGGQDYALSVGDKTVTLDWLAPEALPVFVGVEVWNNALSNDSNASLWDLIKSLGNISEPMLEMSMLQGIQDVIDSVTYSDSKFWGGMVQTATSYISQFVPTLFGQIERTFGEDTRQTTFVDKSSETPGDIQRFLGKLLNKTPGEYQQMDYIDAWGRTQSTGTMLNRALNNFVNPAYISDKNATDVEAELQRLYDKGAGFENVLPSRVSQSTAIEGNMLTQEQFQKFSTEKGQTSYSVLDKLISSSIYRSLSDSAKAAAIKDAYEYANDKAKRSVKSTADVSSWYEKAKESGNPAQYIVARAVLNQALGGETASYEKTVAALDKGLSEEAAYASFNSEQAAKFDSISDTGVSATDYIYAKNYYSNVAKGENKKDDVAAYIQSLPESKEAKLALYQACYNGDTKSKYTSLNYWTDTSGGQRKQSKSNQDDRMLSLFPFG